VLHHPFASNRAHAFRRTARTLLDEGVARNKKSFAVLSDGRQLPQTAIARQQDL